jgi:outer membrane murein-binding lipoprotein Lpp
MRPVSRIGTAPRVIPTVGHAIQEFATGVGFMAETGNVSDVAALVEQLMKALDAKADAHAAATQKPRMPSWVTSLLVGLAVALGTMFVSGLVAYGALQNRVSNLESRTQAIDQLATLNAKIDVLAARFNDMVDGQSRHAK